MAKPSPRSVDEVNLWWALVGLLTISLLSAGFTAWTCDYVLSSFQDSNTMALLITDAGLKSDDAKLEGNLTTATNTLRYLKDIGLAVVVGGAGIALALLVKHFTSGKSSSSGSPGGKSTGARKARRA
jgi:hypothetical protein